MENMNFLRKLPIPKEIKDSYPLNKELLKIKSQNDLEIANILNGIDNRLLIIIGPCSADNPKAVMEYALKIKELQDKYNDKFKFILRCYTAKPRTTSSGYLGLLHQPSSNKQYDLLEGLITCRKLFLNLIENTHLPLADELLYPENFRYFSDLISYVTVGARSVLNQEHRLVSSGLSIPVGLKNSLSGNNNDCENALFATRIDHEFLYRGWEVETTGNKLSHIILRGYIDNLNNNCPNYDINNVISIYNDLINHNLDSKFIIDCNHSNSNKNYLLQIDVAKEVINNKNKNTLYNGLVKGLMIESYLNDGNTTLDNLIYGTSITDSCLGIDKTIKLIEELYDLLNI